ncbi:MAG: transporter substrate-binding domain-containing protein [Oscillospiraceae bacterium]|nr:transporter substrate-binding domain-containing protein [Oscillospiraceae bacterium]
MKKILSLVLVLVMICSLSAVAFAEGKQTLVFGTSADYAPFEFMYPDETGTMVYGGIDVLVAQYIADYLDMDLQIENMDFGYLLTALNKGDFDMVLADIEATEKRQKAADFSESYMETLAEKILIRTEDIDKFQDAATDFNGVSVGAQTGSTKIEKAEKNLVGCVVVPLSLVTDLVNELVNGKIDAILLDGAVAVSYDAQYDQLSIAEKASEVFPQSQGPAVAVAKGDPKGLLPGINEALAKMASENKIEEFQAFVDQIQGIEEVSAEAPEGYEADE